MKEEVIMKTKSFLCLLLMMVFYSCENSTPINLDDDGDAPAPAWSIGLVKFTDDKYSEYIIAEHIIGDVNLRGGSKPAVVEELIVGASPYTIKLPNGYWVVDWKWPTLFYKPTNVLLPYKWESLTSWNQTWNMPENPLSFNEYIADLGWVSRRTIDTYFSINLDVKRFSSLSNLLYETPRFLWNYLSEKDIPEQEKENYFGLIHQQDSLHEVYIQRLTEIINNGDFNKVYKKEP